MRDTPPGMPFLCVGDDWNVTPPPPVGLTAEEKVPALAAYANARITMPAPLAPIPPSGFDQTNPKDLVGDTKVPGRTFASGANRNSDEGKLDYEGFEHSLVRKRFAEYMNSHRRLEDGTLRASNNWTKGMPRCQYLKSLSRHFMDVLLILQGFPSEATEPDLVQALCACKFNTDGLLLEAILGREVTE